MTKHKVSANPAKNVHVSEAAAPRDDNEKRRAHWLASTRLLLFLILRFLAFNPRSNFVIEH